MEELFTSAKTETITPVEATLTGSLPEWLQGSLYRNGPSLFEFGEDKFDHWFDGSAMVHKFTIKDGKVTYCDRFVQSDCYTKNKAANRIVVGEFGTIAHPDPCKTLFQRFFSYFTLPEPGDNTCVHVFPSGDYVYTATETKIIHRIDPTTLDTVGKVDVTKLVGVNGATAHPHMDNDGTLHNLGSLHKERGGPHYAIIKMTPPKPGAEEICESAEIVAKIPAQWKWHPGYFHSFAMTENYYVLVEAPLCVNVLKILTSKLRGKPFLDSMEFYGEYPTRFHIISRKTGEKVHSDYTITADTFTTFHHANAYEDQGHIIVDTCAYTEGLVYNRMSLKTMQSPGADQIMKSQEAAKGRRYVLPTFDLSQCELNTNLVELKYTTATAAKTSENTMYCTPDIICDEPFEFPQINYKYYNGKKYNYIYGLGYDQAAIDCILKIDISGRRAEKWSESGSYPSEPVFVARPEPQSEDDGVLLSCVLTTGPGRHAYLLVLDAKDLTELARATVNVHIPRDLHGSFCQNFF